MVVVWLYAKLNKAKKLKWKDKDLSRGMGIIARANNDTTVSLILRKKIKGNKSPISLLLEKIPIGKEEDIFSKAMY